MLHDQGRPLAGHFGGLGGRHGEVIFGDVEELGGVFCAGFVGYGGADAFVTWSRLHVSDGCGHARWPCWR